MREKVVAMVWPLELLSVVMLAAMFWFLQTDDVLLVGLGALPMFFLMLLSFFNSVETRVRYGVVLAVFGIPAAFAVAFMGSSAIDCIGTEKFGTAAFDYLYFSYTTYTGLGYGDFAPISRSCRLLTMMETMSGFLAVAFLAALFASKFLEQRQT